jgi:hypothetical protein
MKLIMNAVQKRSIAIVSAFMIIASVFFQSGAVVNAGETAAVSGAGSLIITEAYIDDISRPEWVPAGVSAFDPMEYVEIYNPTGNPINFSQGYALYHYRNTGNREFSLPLYGQSGEVMVPAHGSIVLWGFLPGKYAGAPQEQIPTIEDFREAFDIDGSVGVYQVDATSCTGFYNTYNGSFRIKDTNGNLICEAAFTPATDSADGKSIEFRMPAEGTSMLVYRPMADPTPGEVFEEQYYVPPQSDTTDLIITEAYIDDISRPEWVPTGVSTFDPMEYVEIYNPTGSPVNFSQGYALYHFRNSANREYSLPLYGQAGDVIVPAHGSIVLWAFLAGRYAGASAEQIPDIEDFRGAFDIDGSVGVYQVDTTSCIGFYNTYNGSFRIKDTSGSLICEAAFTPATDSADGKSIEFRMAPEGTSMLVYRQMADPTPGAVSEEQYTRPPVPNQPVIGNIAAKDVYANGESFTVSADITDAQRASIYLKQSDATAYMQIPMENHGDGTFGVSVPRTKLWGETLKWYIEAYNDTRTTRSVDKTSIVQYPYDPAKQPQVLITELKTEDTDYNYIEFYNNSDDIINFVYYNVFYEYPSGLSYLRWAFNTNALYIGPGKTLVVWINDDEKTVAQFNSHYGVHLEENKSIIKVDYSGMSPNIERTIKLGNTYSNPIAVATYHEDEIDDTAKTTSIHYTYSRDNGTRMAKADISSAPTPGAVAAWQVPAQRVPFDNYGGSSDDENSMVLRPREPIPEAIGEGEALNVAFDCYDTETGVNTIETYYRFDDEGEYHVKMEKTQRIAKQLITSIPASEFLGHKKVAFYIRAYNAFRHHDTQVYSVSITPSINTEGLVLNVKDHQIVSGVTDIAATAGSGARDISIEIDGQEQSVSPVPEKGGYFSYKAGNLTSYYKNAITVGDKVVKLLSSWANVNWKAAHIDSRSFIKKANGDYEVTVTLRAGSEGSPFEETGTHAPFTMSNMALYLPDGTFIYPDNGIEYERQYTIGDGANALDVHFTIPGDRLLARGFTLDTAGLSEGEHVVRTAAGDSSTNAVIVVDNAAPEVDFGIEDGQALESGDVISPSVRDAGSGIDDAKTEITLDDKKIDFPYTVYGGGLENGTHNLRVSYTDKAGHTAQKSISFTTDITLPDAVINSVEQTESTKAAISVQVGRDGKAVDVEFLEGKQFSLEQNDIQVSAGAGDDPLMKGGSDSLASSSEKELPYQLFRVRTGDLDDEAVIEANWKGSGDAPGVLRMFVLNVAGNEWEPVAAADQGQIKASFKAKDHVKEGEALLLVQNRSDGSLPSARSGGAPGNTDGGSADGYAWDGTGVPESYDFSFAWISDPQYYVESWPDHYTGMNRWILDNRDTYNIKYTINTGDLIDEWDRDEQWQIADRAQRLFDDAGMPNGVLAGNHDVASGNEEYGSYWKYFGEQRYKDNYYYGGSYRNNLGHYDLISAGGQDFIILYMSWDVYQPEVEWMNSVLAQYPERKAIIAMHRYLKQGGTLDYAGELVQREVVAKNPNVFAVLNGHYFGAAIKIDGFDDDGDGVKERRVYQICTDYQGAVEGGLQYLKMLYFDLDNGKIYMNAYSPYLDDFNYFDSPKLPSYDIGVTSASQDIYELDARFDTGLKTLETTQLNVDVYTDRSIGVQENVTGEVTQIWEGLRPDTQYWWYGKITNEKGDIFRTPLAGVHTLGNGGPPLPAPVITSVIPGDSRVAMSWRPVDGAAGYKIFSGTAPDGCDTEIGTVDGSAYSYEAAGLTNGVRYYFVIRAVADIGESESSEEIIAVPQAPLPGAPEILSAEAGDGHVKINWSPVEGSMGYTIYSSTSSAISILEDNAAGYEAYSTTPGAIYVAVGTVDSSVHDYDILNLTNGTRYYFAVTSTNPDGEGPYSNEARVTPQSASIIPDAPTGVKAEGGNSKVVLTWNNSAGATGYRIYQSETPGSYGDGYAAVSGSVRSYEAAGLTNGVTYYFVIKAVNERGESGYSAEVSAVPGTVPGAPTGVTASAGDGRATVSFTAPADDGGSPITGYIVTTSPGGITVTGTGTAITVTGLRNGTAYTFTVRAVNSFGSSRESTASNEVTPYGYSGGNNSGGGGAPEETAAPGKSGMGILINSRTETIATAVKTEENGKTVTTITVDEDKMEEMLGRAGNNATVTIPFDADSDAAVLRLNGRTVKNMKDREAGLEIKTGNVIYMLPAAQISPDDISLQTGAQAKWEDMAVSIRISAPPQETADIIEAAANQNNYQVLIKPVEFEITFTNGNGSVGVSRFSGYVERMIAIPEGVDPQKITTGVVLNPDGTFSHVPTAITAIDGKYYAKISSLTNSIYLAIGNPKTFKDVEKHWAREIVNDMGSRLIVDADASGRFEPDRSMTRAEFASVAVRALGLLRPGTGKGAFRDVTKDDRYYEAVSIASEYGLISGDGNGDFKALDRITREQAMVIIAKAMEITGLKAEFKDGETEALLAAFGDSGQVSSWARKSTAACVKAGIVSGKPGKTLAPGDEITRAETAVIVRELLRRSELI